MDAERTAQLVARLRELSTSTVSDALDKLRRPGAVPGILPFDAGFRVCGPAYTGRYEAMDAAGGTVGDYVDDVEPGSVIVLDNDGRLDCTVWGDILTRVAGKRGIGGTVINGVCRDIEPSLRLGYPVFSRGRSMQTGKDRVRLAGTQVPVRLGRVTLRPGDLVLGDADGVVVLAADNAEEVLDTAISIELAERGIRDAVESGCRLDAARRQSGYHKLQTPAGFS